MVKSPISNDVPDTAVKIYANNWVATVFASPEADASGFFAVYATTVGASAQYAGDAATFVLNAFAFGRTAVIRVAPESNSEKNFATQTIRHHGFVRFSYKLEAGGWHYLADEDIKIPSIGEAV